MKVISEHEEELKVLEGISNLLHFDNRTQMPKKAGKQRAKQDALISGKMHEVQSSATLKRALDKAVKHENFNKLSFIEQRRVKRLIKDVHKARALPQSFVIEYSELVSEAESVWQEAKETSNYDLFKPYLKKIIAKKKEYAKLINKEKPVYDVLLDDYEEEMTKEKLDEVFGNLRPKLVALLEKIKKSPRFGKKTIFENKKVPANVQRKHANKLAKLILKDENKFILRESSHPFSTTINPDDVRITTAVRDNPIFCLSSTTHEAGHSLYESQIGKDLRYTVLHDGVSLGIHESQSRFFENHVLEDKHFLKKLRKEMEEDVPFLKSVSDDDFYYAFNKVEPGFIRIEADELTYSLHVIIRYEIEKGIFNGTYDVDNLPKVWNDKYEEYLGIRPETDAKGILQDVHWSSGAMGYFPTYSLGSMYSATIRKKMSEDLDFRKLLENRDFDPIRSWLKERVHKHGRTFKPEELRKKATGDVLRSDDYIEYLTEKFSDIYLD